MKTKKARIPLKLSLLFLAMTLPLGAASYVNNFDVSQDYLVNGVIGDTNWDGVYLRFGDVPLANNGGDGNGNTTIANASISFPGFLTVQSTATSWAGAGNDGFFLYKFVSGDFDAAVQVYYPFANPNYHFAGLLARAATPSGTGFNQAENFVTCTRFQEFNIGEHVRYTLNNDDTDGYLVSPGDNADLNTIHGVRITRVGDLFSFYNRTNGDAWHLMGTLPRPEWAGVPMQVGIQDAFFTANTAPTYFTGFELSGPNVNFPVMPAAPSALVSTASNPGGSLTLSWTPGNPANSSLVVMRAQGTIQHNPVQGVTYTANPAFGDPATRLGGASQYVVFNGVGNSVTVTNLGGNNLTYSVAVYEYTGSGAATVYNTLSPATNSFAGPGIITAVNLSIVPTNIPLGGATVARLLATFSTGESNVDQTANTTWSSSDPDVAMVNTDGTISGLATGSAVITGTFGTFTPTATVTVHSPVFADNFGTTHDYLTNGLQESTWDGLFLNFGDVPGANRGSEGTAGQTLQLIADTNILYLQAAGGSWRVAGNDGPFLFKIVTGDFQASVRVINGTINNNYAGIMARLFNNSKTSSQGGGGGTGGMESHINWGNPQQGIPSARRTIDNGGTTIRAGLSANDRWLLMSRVDATNFLFFERANPTDPWSAVPTATMVLDQAANNAPMQVGLFQEMRQAATDFAQFDTFMLDGPGIVSPSGSLPPPPASDLTATVNADLSMTFTWVAASNGVPVQSILVMRDGGPVTAQPTYGFGFTVGAGTYPFGTATSLGDGNYLVFRSASPPPSTSNTATITGLIPGHTYYAAVYTFAGAFPDRVFNSVLPPTGATASIRDGVLLGLRTPPVPSVPAGGVEVVKVFGVFTGGTELDISAAATVMSTNTTVAEAVNNIVTGKENGTATLAVFVSGSPFTNYLPVTVRAPIFTDNFAINRDYLVTGVAGTSWDGVYRQGIGTNEVPGSEYMPAFDWGTAVADANVSSNNVLTVTAVGDGWEDGNVGGFFLFKYVPGDFQMAVHLTSFDVANYNQPGLLARAYRADTNGIGAPFVLGEPRTNVNNIEINAYGESWVSLTRFDEFNIGTYARLTLDSATQQSTQPDQDDGAFWLLILRRNGTDFSFYKRSTVTEPWRPLPNRTTYQQSEFAGAPMQVGLMAGPWWWTAGVNRSVMFDHFMLDATTGSPLQISIEGNDVVITWPAIPGTLQSTTTLSAPNWQQAGGQPVLSNGLYRVVRPISPGAIFYRLAQ